MKKLGVKNIISERSNREVANQFVIETARGTFFQSYESVIARVDNKHRLTISGNWDYSNTTRKHLYSFLRDNGFGEYCSADAMRNAIKEKKVKYRTIPSLKI